MHRMKLCIPKYAGSSLREEEGCGNGTESCTRKGGSWHTERRVKGREGPLGTSVKRMKHGFHGTGWVLSLFLPHCAPMPRWLHPSSIITGLPVLQMENGEVQTEWPEGNFVGALVVTFFKGFGPCGLLNDNWLLAQTISTRSPPPNMQDSTACQRWAELGRALPHTDYSMRMAPHSYVATWRNHKLPLHRL